MKPLAKAFMMISILVSILMLVGLDFVQAIQSPETITETDQADDAAYTSGWANGSNGGSGFGAWQLIINQGFGGSNAGFFISTSTNNGDGDSNADNDIDTTGQAWGMFANSFGLAEAVRPLNTPLNINDTLHVSLDNGFIDAASAIGWSIRNPNDDNIFAFGFTGGDASYSYSDTNAQQVFIPISFTDEGLDLTFTLLTTNTYQATATPLATGTTYTWTDTLITQASGYTATQLLFVNANAGNGSSNNFYVNSLSIDRNDAPTVVDDTTSTLQDTSVTISPLTNDSDPNGHSLAIASVGTPISGTATISGSQVIYTPTMGFAGTDSFTYVVSDSALTDTGTITVNVQAVISMMIPAMKDNTLYESGTGTVSNGSGDYFFAGVNGSTGGNVPMRGLVAFDLSAIPAGVTILDSALSVTTDKNTGTINLYRLEADWGEGASNAPLGEAGGTTAEVGDATWLHTFYDTALWMTPGGDFTTTVSADYVVASNGAQSISSAQMTQDVQAWVDGSVGNYGWIIRNIDESTASNTIRFASRENGSGSPMLQVSYLAPPAQASSVTLERNSLTIATLNWTAEPAVNCGYQVHRDSSNSPYFTPDGSTLYSFGTLTADTDTFVLSSDLNGNNYFYVVQAIGCNGDTDNSNRTGIFNFAIVPGS